jgi:hypothetical protein
MTPPTTPVDERYRVAELIRLLATVHCIDSNIYIEVNSKTFESFPGRTQVIADNDSMTSFRSKRVYGDPGLPGSAGCGLEIVLWTAQKRRLRVVA